MASLIDLAVNHIRQNDLKGRTPIYSAARFVRMMGDIDPLSITEDHFRIYRAKCLEAKLSAKTIESSIGNIVTTVAMMTGHKLKPGRKLRLKRPEPKPADHAAISAVYNIAPQWLKGWVGFSLWTGLRLSDSIETLWRISGTDPGPVLYRRANKTGRQHVWPMPVWLRDLVSVSPFPQEYCLENTKKVIRKQMASCCESAGLEVFGPKNIRQRAINEWSKANATAGAILHGCGLGVLHHYLDPLTVLESAASRVKLPDCFEVTENGEENLLTSYRRLDPSAQSLIGNMAERLAAG